MIIHDKQFELFISSNQIQSQIADLAERISADYADKCPLFIGVLNGSFMFASDLLKEVNIPAEITFIKVASYAGMQSTGKTRELLGLSQSVKDRHVVVVEDIVDSGITMEGIIHQLEQAGVASVEVASLLLKPECLQREVDVKYVGFEIPEKFVVGYGLDYDGLGRNLKDIYQLRLD
ncbi:MULTISPECIES: hypoxanthine phosphoribosyltransferase [Roseivirga]|uniref:hypoxanthine phosphoribosyltransferase n=1 Tax=Roseivirga TaxID=290180 RepID=UPI00257B25FC|nr:MULTISPECIES: hypoxanthine phosphoribosyltransferase [Roseivirga]MEC7753030.1 hypoxanthine phosphoribosyltransferase [Bacteroidota bacterium]|tara:strand:+ start:140 stop:670 length:531 start_codon:yes stop_codon:yes gene_type:complete